MLELLSPPDLTVVETTHFAAKIHTIICCGLNKMRYYIFQCLTALSSFWFHVLFTLYFACWLKHSQFLHKVAVETHPFRKPICPVGSLFFSGPFLCPFKNDNLCLQCTVNSLSHYRHPAFTGMLLINLCVLKGLLNCLMSFLFFLN